MAFNAKQTAIDKRMEKTAKNILLFLENKTEDYENRVALGIRTTHGWNEFTYKGIGAIVAKTCLLSHQQPGSAKRRQACYFVRIPSGIRCRSVCI